MISGTFGTESQTVGRACSAGDYWLPPPAEVLGMSRETSARAGRRYRCALIIGAIAAVGYTAPARAQEAQPITGRVLDQSNNSPIPAAAVLVTGTSLGTQNSDS